MKKTFWTIVLSIYFTLSTLCAVGFGILYFKGESAADEQSNYRAVRELVDTACAQIGFTYKQKDRAAAHLGFVEDYYEDAGADFEFSSDPILQTGNLTEALFIAREIFALELEPNTYYYSSTEVLGHGEVYDATVDSATFIFTIGKKSLNLDIIFEEGIVATFANVKLAYTQGKNWHMDYLYTCAPDTWDRRDGFDSLEPGQAAYLFGSGDEESLYEVGGTIIHTAEGAVDQTGELVTNISQVDYADFIYSNAKTKKRLEGQGGTNASEEEGTTLISDADTLKNCNDVYKMLNSTSTDKFAHVAPVVTDLLTAVNTKLLAIKAA